MENILKSSCAIGLILSSSAFSQDYDYQKLSVGQAHYKIDSDATASAYQVQYRTLVDNIVLQGNYSRLNIETYGLDLDANQFIVSAGYAITNTDKTLTAIGLSFGRVDIDDYDASADYKALNLVHSYQATDSVEFNTRLTRVFADDSDNYFEAEIGFTFNLASNFGIYTNVILDTESEKVFAIGADIQF